MEQLLLETSHHSTCSITSTADWSRIASGFPSSAMTFACLSATNVHYGPFGELQEGPSSAFQITTGSIMGTYYGKYDKLLEGPGAKLMLNNDEIARDKRDIGSQDYWRIIAGNAVDGVTDAVDPIDGVLAKVLIYLFSPLSPRFNLPASVLPACTGQSLLLTLLPYGLVTNCLGNKFRFFSFSVLLISLQGLN